MKEYHARQLDGRERPSRDEEGASKASTTARASRLCPRPGDKFDRKKCCSSGITVAVFTIGATLLERAARSSYRFAAPPRLAQFAVIPPVGPADEQASIANCEKAAHAIAPVNRFFGPSFRFSPARLVTHRDTSLSHWRMGSKSPFGCCRYRRRRSRPSALQRSPPSMRKGRGRRTPDHGQFYARRNSLFVRLDDHRMKGEDVRGRRHQPSPAASEHSGCRKSPRG